MNKDAKIFVAGHRGLVGSAIVRKLRESGYKQIITRTKEDLDLREQAAVNTFFKNERPDYVFLAAARVGGILANSTYMADFIYDNLMIATNVIKAAYENRVKKLLNMGSSCIYPKLAPQPLKEEYLLTGLLEPTNEPYAVAKIAAMKLCRYFNEQYGTNFISVMPTNLYGINDNFNLETSHVLPALIRKVHEAKVTGKKFVELWGDGSPRREFLYADDLADAVIFLMERYGYKDIGEFVNVGTGEDIAIKELATMIAACIEYKGEFHWDINKPNGTPRKILNISKIKQLGWEPKTQLVDGIRLAYEFYSQIHYRNK